MSDNYYPPRPTGRRLERSRSDRVIGGVCGGVAKYLNMDPTLVRVLTVFLVLFFGFPLIAYLIALFVMPEEDPNARNYPPVDRGAQFDAYSPYGTQAPSAYPQYDPAQYDPAPRSTSDPRTQGSADPVWGPEGAPWEQPQPPRGPRGSDEPPARA
jgi:phage shock protein PspC (stress-responsive transcriptional regulator)